MNTLYPLLQAQLGIFLECQAEPESARYNLAAKVVLPHYIDLDRLVQAIHRVIEARPTLRTCFMLDEEGTPRQYIDKDMQITVSRLHMSDADVDEFTASYVKPFDLLSGSPLCRFDIVETESRTLLYYDLHHIIADGLTFLTLFFKEDLDNAYQGKPLQHELKSLQDYVLEEEQQMKSQSFAEAARYYKEKFAGEEFVDLAGAKLSKLAPVQLVYNLLDGKEVKAWCQEHHVKDNNLFQAAYALALSRISRKQKVAYTSVRHGRFDKSLLRTYGMFVKTVPVLMDAEPDKLVSEFVAEMADEWKSTYKMADYSFPRLCTDLHLMPTVAFTYQGAMLAMDFTLDGQPVQFEQLRQGLTGADLTFFVYLQGDSYSLRLMSSSALYPKQFLERFAKAVKQCVYQFMKQWDEKLSDVSLVSEQEEQQLVALGTGEQLDFDKSETLVSLFEKQARQTPDAIAVVYQDRSYTYRQIDELANRLAVYLQKQYGVKRETAVGVMIDRSEWQVIYPLAIMKAGGAYMPLDFHFPEDRLSYMIEDAKVRLILSENTLVKDTLPNFCGDVLLTDDVLKLPETAEQPTDAPRPDDMYVILYTSGSTGRPKGCVLEHHGIVNYCHWYVKELGLTSADRSVAYANFGFDAHMMDAYPLLACGGSVYILPSDMRMDLTAMHRYMEDNAVTVAFFTTQIGVQMASLFEYSHLRVMSVGGEKLVPIKKPPFTYYNLYGPTECTLCSTFYLVKYDNEEAPIGRPLANYQLYVMDASMHLVPQGMPGELCVAGQGVGRGYLNNPEMTDAKFVTVDGVRMYRTGDLVRWDEDGNIVFLGRMDGQVKLRGLRIEIGEIESVLAQYDDIKTSAVVVQEVNGVQMLCAYYTSDHEVDEQKLRAFLGESLTEFMVPEIYVRMDVMPLTPNGKVNRKALPLPEMKLGEIVKPETPAEQQLFDIVAKYLGTDNFGVTTNLITMGLTSIGAIKLSVVLQKQMNLHLSTKDMMRHPEIRQWLKSVHTATATDEALQVYAKQSFYPLTPNQLGIYIDWEQHPNDLQYNIPYLLKFSNVDPALLKKSVEQALAAHPYIKVRLLMHEGEIMQERHDDDAVEVKLIELDEAPTPAYFQEQIHPFNIIGQPLYDIRVYTYGSDTWLLINIHHIVFDGTSMNVLLNDIAQAYAQHPLVAETITAYDYALYYQQWQKGQGFKDAEKHFDLIMDKAESVQYPPSANGMTHQGAQKTRVSMPRSAITHCAQHLGVTENALVMTAVMQTLHRITREHNIMITTISNGRNTTDLATDFGMFVQTLPVVSHFGNKSVAEVVKDMHEQLLATIDADKYPFTNIVERYGVSPQIMVAYQGDVMDDVISLGNAQGEQIPLRLDTVKTPVSIDVWNRAGNQIELEIEYDSDVYTEASMQTLGKAIAALLQRMATAECDTPVNSLAITTDEEQARLIQLGQGPQVDMDVTKTFANLFVEQAHKTPERLAVADADSELSYGDMDAYSNLLAHKFIEQGIQPDDLVCVMLERTKEFPLTVLALHKCGAAYVPLDFEYPNQRLSFMIEDSESKLLITTHDVLEAALAEGEFNIGQAQPFFIDDLLTQPDAKVQAMSAAPIDLSKPEGVAYMIYTSGSTGTPKGARLHQAGLHNFIATVIYMEQLTANDRISGHSSFSFDAHVEDMFPILTLGGSFHLIPSAIRKDLGEIRQFLFDHRITGGGYSTAVTCLLLNTFDDLPVRFITAGGEKLPSVCSDHIVILNTYGPTEGTVDTTYYPMEPGVKMDEIPIGRTVANCWNFVVDETGNMLPQGIAGELCFAGIQVSMGYWHREEQTAKVFGDCPFVEKDAWGRKVRMYHTGDLCHWNDDGQLEYISRIDTQVKLRGFRIELGEIENAISRYEGIRSTIVVVKEIGGMQHLCAYYTADKDIDSNQLREYLSQSLTEYMVPDAYMQMDELPLTPNGKVNRKALPEPVIEQAAVSAYAEPEGEMEIDIAEAFAKVLNMERVSANDDFFLLGGTSVSAIKVVAALALKNYQLSFKDMFACKTPRVLAAYLRGKADGSAAPAQQSIVIDNSSADNNASRYADILDANTIEKFRNGERQPIGDVLLTGATGFMGIHFLHELIENESGRIYCLLRSKGKYSAESRLRSLLFYYFDKTYEELFGNRLVVLEGELTAPATFEKLDIHVDTVVNCAANVKHFSAGNDIEMVNVESVRNLIAWCLKTGARLVHTSTTSVAGQSVDGYPSADTVMNEHMFDFGQSLANQYVRSKYDAEQLILESIRKDGLNAKIMRVATLASRNADGEFQINFRTNGFMGRLRSYAALGCAPYDVLDAPCEFSPIDEVCKASRLLATTPRDMVVFHPCNNHTLPLGDVLTCLHSVGVDVKFVEREEFDERVREMMSDDANSQVLQPLLAYADNGAHKVRFIDYDSEFTTQVLYRLGYHWPFTSWDYVERFVQAINGFDFFKL